MWDSRLARLLNVLWELVYSVGFYRLAHSDVGDLRLRSSSELVRVRGSAVSLCVRRRQGVCVLRRIVSSRVHRFRLRVIYVLAFPKVTSVLVILGPRVFCFYLFS